MEGRDGKGEGYERLREGRDRGREGDTKMDISSILLSSTNEIK